MKRMTDEEYQIIMANVIRGMAPPPGNPLKFLARKKGIQTMKEQAKRLRKLQEEGKLKDEPMADWLAKPFKKPPPKK
jgi:hypothetical protein